MKVALPLVLISLILSFHLSADFQIKKNLHVQPGESFAGSILSIGGSIVIEGKINGTIILMGGQIRINGSISEDVICFASRIILEDQTSIHGDFIAIGGSLEKSRNCQIGGKYLHSNLDLTEFRQTFIPFVFGTATTSFFNAIFIIIWFIIAMTLFAVIPKRIIEAHTILEKNITRVGALGIISVLTLIILFMIFIILSFILIGLPLLLLLILAFIFVTVFGRTVMFYFLGHLLLRLFKRQDISAIVFVITGVLVYALLHFIPLIGPVLLLLMNVFAVGIGTVYLLRKKLRLSP